MQQANPHDGEDAYSVILGYQDSATTYQYRHYLIHHSKLTCSPLPQFEEAAPSATSVDLPCVVRGDDLGFVFVKEELDGSLQVIPVETTASSYLSGIILKLMSQ